MQRSLLLFEESIKSEKTRKIYRFALNKFIEFYKLKDHDSRIKTDPKMLQTMVEDYVMALKREKLTKSTIGLYVSARKSSLRLMM